MSKRILKAIFDNLIQSLILVCLGYISVSTFASNLYLKQYLFIGALGAMLSAFIYLAFTIKEHNNRKLVYFSLIDILCFVLCIVSVLTICLTFKFNFWFLREVNNADGILILFAIASYILGSIILRTCIFVTLIIKNMSRVSRVSREPSP